MATTLNRVLYVVNAFESDAPTATTVQLANALQKSGWHCKMVAWSRTGPLHEKLKQLSLSPVVAGSNLLQRTAGLAKAIAEFRPSIVHSILVRPTMGTYWSRIASRENFAWIAGDHGIHEWDQGGRITGFAMHHLMPAIYTSADAVVTVSASASRSLAAAGVRRDNLHIVTNGVDSTRFYPGSKAERCAFLSSVFPGDDPALIWPLIGSAGNLRPIKGHADLIQAMPKILDRWPSARIVIWGEGPEQPRLLQLARQISVDHAVAILPYDSLIERRLPLLDLYAQPSHVESFGLAPAEAMCCGVPAVLSDAGGLPELAAQGEVAWLFPARNYAALAETVLEALYNKQRLRRRGAAGRGWILKNYTTVQFVNNMTSLYEQVLSERGLPNHG